MTHVKQLLCCFFLFSSATVSQAVAWHGPCGFNGHGYGFGLNHHSFRPSVYNPGWSSYSRASFYSSYGYGGVGYSNLSFGSCWPRAIYPVSYRSYAPVYYTSSWPNYYTSYYVPSYYTPTYCAPITYGAYYTPYVAPVVYSNFYTGFPSCSVLPTVNSLPVAANPVRKLGASSATFRLASQPVHPAPQAQAPQAKAPAGRYVLAQAAPSALPATLDSAPEELIAAADAILAAGGYRQAAQAYAQIVVKHGNSDRLATRRFIAQVANGDLEQAGVVIELATVNGNRLDRKDLPQGDLQIALGDRTGLIATRSESLAAIALQQSDDAVPMLAVAHWLAFSGDSDRAELFKARADQMQAVTAGLLIHKPGGSQKAAYVSAE